jgi:hypothetical protein
MAARAAIHASLCGLHASVSWMPAAIYPGPRSGAGMTLVGAIRWTRNTSALLPALHPGTIRIVTLPGGP